MKYSLFFLALLLVVNTVLASDIAYVVKNVNSPDPVLLGSINKLGYSYELIDDSKIAQTNFSKYSLILIGNERIINVPVDSYKSIVVNDDYYETWSSTIGSISSNQDLLIYNVPESEITEGIDGYFKVYTIKDRPVKSLLGKKNGCTKITTVESSGSGFSEYVVAFKESPKRIFFGITETEYWSNDSKELFERSLIWLMAGEDRDKDGYVLEEDCNDNNPNTWHYLEGYLDSDGDGYGTGDIIGVCSGLELEEGYSETDGDCDDSSSGKWQYIEGYLDWDNDGYGVGEIIEVCSGNDLEEGYSEIDGDCDDSSSGKWGYIEGYLDSDGDGYGTGNLIGVCSGLELEEGYSETDGDCDNSDDKISPHSEEIEYDGIDNNCSGGDLIDADGDGYVVDCKFVEGICEVIGGDDCDDADSETHPFSGDFSKNCINDMPVINNIEKLTVSETEVVRIEVSADDPEGDELVYEINSTDFIPDGNVFLWETGYEDEGDYFFEVTVSDGEYSTKTLAEVKVLEKSREPACIDIPEIRWEEDENSSINLNSYCSDPDGDELRFYVYNTSQDRNITVNQTQKGIMEFSTNKNWNGEDWIIFAATDEENRVFTNNIILAVEPVNDEPVFNGFIENITFDEDSEYVSDFSLGDFFEDADSSLEYSVSGNVHINVDIVDDKIVLNPEAEWYGNESVVLLAEDEEYSAESNEFMLIVRSVNEPPEFGEFSCLSDIEEEKEYSCELNGTDIEEDEISFVVVSENNLHCAINGNILDYSSYKDYNGNASCLIRADDEYGEGPEFRLDVSVENVNDAPEITSSDPAGDYIKILEGETKLFSLAVFDADSLFNISWFVDDAEVSDGDSYRFDEGKGVYNLSAVATDGELESSRLWKVLVGGIENFTCSEAGGNICGADQICTGEILGVYDSTSCCTIQCSEKPPEFSDINNRENVSDKIELTIEDPDGGDSFYLGEEIRVELRIENNADEELDFDVEAYLYDLTEDVAVEDIDDSVDVEEGDSESVTLYLQVPEDAEDGNDYAVFARVISDDYYNENYLKIETKRKDYDVRIKSVGVNPSSVSCGDYPEINVKVENFGRKDQEVYLKVGNSELDINMEGEKFDLDSEGGTSSKRFEFKIPEKISEKDYVFKVSAVYGSYTDSREITLKVDDCKVEEAKIEEINKITLESSESNSVITKSDSKKSSFNKSILITLLIVTFALIVVFLTFVYLIARGSSELQTELKKKRVH